VCEGTARLLGAILGDLVKAAARTARLYMYGGILPDAVHPADLFQAGQDRIDRARRQSRQLAQLQAVALFGGILPR
jgi:hypothetical protein